MENISGLSLAKNLKSSFPLRFKARQAEGGCGGNSASRAQPVPFGYFQTDTARQNLLSITTINMAILLRLMYFLSLVGLAACSTPKDPNEIDMTQKYLCKTDDDCTNSCSQGAVNAGWYAQYFSNAAECYDGCDGKWMGKPRCEEGQCVAYLRDGTKEDSCTRPRPNDNGGA